MPWNECKPMDERLRFIARLLEGEKMSPLCREFGIGLPPVLMTPRSLIMRHVQMPRKRKMGSNRINPTGGKTRFDPFIREFIALRILAREVYGWLEQQMSPGDAVQKALTLFEDGVDIGLLVLTRSDYAADARKGMPWSYLIEAR
jgi:hypothetical protein